MKKYMFFVLVFISSSVLFAKKSDLFSYDKETVREAFIEADRLDQYVSRIHTGLDQMDLSIPMMSRFSRDNYGMMEEPLLGISGFWWGCCFGELGIIATLLTGDNKEITRSIAGCLLANLVWGGGYLLMGSLN